MTEVTNKIRFFNAINNRMVAIVVTYNRKELLTKVIDALLNQTLPCDILIVDNASTDGTENLLSSSNIFSKNRFNYICLSQNIGGAGGFSRGLKIAMETGWNWFWLMDDDAIPDKNALKYLFEGTEKEKAIFASATIGR